MIGQHSSDGYSAEEQAVELGSYLIGLTWQAGRLDANGVPTTSIDDLDLFTSDAYYAMVLAQGIRPFNARIFTHGTTTGVNILMPRPQSGSAPSYEWAFAATLAFDDPKGRWGGKLGPDSYWAGPKQELELPGLYDWFVNPDRKTNSPKFTAQSKIYIMGCKYTEPFEERRHLINSIGDGQVYACRSIYTSGVVAKPESPNNNTRNNDVLKKLAGQFFKKVIGADGTIYRLTASVKDQTPLTGTWSLNGLKVPDSDPQSGSPTFIPNELYFSEQTHLTGVKSE